MAQRPKSKKQKYDPRVVGALAAGTEQLEEVEGYAQAARWLGGDDSVDLESLPGTLALSAVEAAVRTRAVARLQALDSASKDLRKLSRAGLHRLKASGVEIEPVQVSAGSFTLGREEVNIPPKAFLTPADDQGYSEFVLGVTDAEGSCVLMGWFGGAEGFRELSHGHVSRSSLRKLFREVDEQIQHMVEVPFAEALSHILPSVERAEQLNGHAPHDWDHFATHLTADMLSAAEQVDALGELPESPEEGQLDATAALAQHPWFGTWPVSQGALHDAMGAFFGGMADEDPEEGEAGEEEDEAATEERNRVRREALDARMAGAASRALEDEGIRDEWLRRARLAATLARGAEDKEVLEILRHVSAALQQGVSADKLGMTTGLLQAQVIQQAFQGMQGLGGDPSQALGGLNGEPEWE